MDKVKDNNKSISKESLYTIIASLAMGGFVLFTIFFSFNIYLYIFTLLFVSIFIFRKAEVGLFLIVVITMLLERFFTLQPMTIGENVYKIYPLDIVVIITAISYTIYYIRSPDVRFRISRIGSSILFFVALCVGATLYGVATDGDTNVAISTMKNFGLYSVFFFLTINIIRTREQLSRLTKVFIYTGAGLLFFVFYGFIRGGGLWTEFTPLSTEGVRLLAPTHAFYLSVVVLLAFNLFAFRKKIFGGLTIPIILVQLIGIIGSLTRHLWIALAISLVISFIFLSRRNKKNLVRIIAIQLLLVIIAISIYGWFAYIVTGKSPGFFNDFLEVTVVRLQSLGASTEDSSSSFRIYAWQEALNTFIENPAIGIGFGKKLTFDFFGYPSRIEIRELHNDFVGIAVQMGLLGIASFSIFLYMFFKKSYLTFKEVGQKLKPYLLGYFTCFVLFIISANFGVYFDINLLGIFFWIFAGAVVTISYIKSEEKEKAK